MEVIDEEVTKILQDAAQKSLNMLGDRQSMLQDLTEQLIKEEELDQKEIRAIIGASVHDERLEKKNGQLNAESNVADSDNNEPVTSNSQDDATNAS